MNLVIIVDGTIFRREAPVLNVFHNIDGDWQFLSGYPVSVSDANIIGLGEMLDQDPTLREIMDMPRGHVARRSERGGQWSVKPHAANDLK